MLSLWKVAWALALLKESSPVMPAFDHVGDSASRFASIGLGVGFFVGLIARWNDWSWQTLIDVGAIAAFFAAGGAAVGILAEGLARIH